MDRFVDYQPTNGSPVHKFIRAELASPSMLLDTASNAVRAPYIVDGILIIEDVHSLDDGELLPFAEREGAAELWYWAPFCHCVFHRTISL